MASLPKNIFTTFSNTCEGVTSKQLPTEDEASVVTNSSYLYDNFPLDPSSGRSMFDILRDDYKISPNSSFVSSTSIFQNLNEIIIEAKKSEVVIHIQNITSPAEQIIVIEAFEDRCKHLIFMLKELKRIKVETEEELRENTIIVKDLTSRLQELEVKDNDLEAELKAALKFNVDLTYNVQILEEKIFSLQGTIQNAQRSIIDLNAEIAGEEVQLSDLLAVKEMLKKQIAEKLSQDENEMLLLKESEALLEKNRLDKIEKIKSVAVRLEKINKDRKEFTKHSVITEKKSLDQISAYNIDIYNKQNSISFYQNSKKDILQSIVEKEKLNREIDTEIDKIKSSNCSILSTSNERMKELEAYTEQQVELLSDLEELRFKDSHFDTNIECIKKEIFYLNTQLDDVLLASIDRKKEQDKNLERYEKLIKELEAENNKLDLTLSQLAKIEYVLNSGLNSINALEKRLSH
jgi:chromosome segregation ATPase